MVLPITPNGSVNFELVHSQGCYKCKKRIKTDIKVYLNEEMQLVPLDKKDHEIFALKRTISNLQKVIHDIEQARQHDQNELLHKVSRIVDLTEQNFLLLRLDTFKKVTEVLNEIEDSDSD